jgi:hypothetical protein
MKTLSKYIFSFFLVFTSTIYADDSTSRVQSLISETKSDFWLKLAYSKDSEGKYSEAFENYTKASQHNSGEAYFWLYQAYLNGKGTQQDKNKAMEMLEKSVELGYTPAQSRLAMELIGSYKNAKERDRAIALFEDAAKKEDPTAYTYLYYIYSMGLHAKKNLPKAYEYARLANTYGADIAVPSSSASTAKTTSSKDLVRQIQINLKMLGFYNGSVDGISGPMTVKALKNFQKSKGLPQTGELNEEVLEHTQKAIK